MSFARSLAARRAPLVSYGVVQRAAFSQSISRAAAKESKLHEEGRDAEAEALKQEQLKKQKQGKQHWEEGLASDSESILKAEKGESGKETNGETIKKLQNETAKATKKEL